MPSVCFVSNYSLHLRTLTLNHIAYENTKVFTRHHAPSRRYTTQYELKTKLIRYGLSLGYDYETVLDSAAALVTDTETCDEF